MGRFLDKLRHIFFNRHLFDINEVVDLTSDPECVFCGEKLSKAWKKNRINK